MAGAPGIEPGPTESKSVALPLRYAPKNKAGIATNHSSVVSATYCPRTAVWVAKTTHSARCRGQGIPLVGQTCSLLAMRRISERVCCGKLPFQNRCHRSSFLFFKVPRKGMVKQWNFPMPFYLIPQKQILRKAESNLTSVGVLRSFPSPTLSPFPSFIKRR